MNKLMSNDEMSTYEQRKSSSRDCVIPTCPFQHLLQLPEPYSGSGPLKGRQKMQFEYSAPCWWPTQVITHNTIRPASQEAMRAKVASARKCASTMHHTRHDYHASCDNAFNMCLNESNHMLCQGTASHQLCKKYIDVTKTLHETVRESPGEQA